MSQERLVPQTGEWTPGTPNHRPCPPFTGTPAWMGHKKCPHRGLSGGCHLLPRTTSTEAVSWEPSPDKAPPAAQKSVGNAGWGQLRVYPDRGTSVSSSQGSEMTPGTVAVLSYISIPHKNPQQSMGHSECAQTCCPPRLSPETRRSPCPAHQDSHCHTGPYLAHRGAVPDLLPL